MSTTIDQRVVEMQFDNQSFERNVQTSMTTLDKLKQSLSFTGASKGLENVSSAAKNVNFSGLASAVDTISAKFSALQVMGVTALANITNSAVNAGKRIASALTIDPIKTGFSEYETQINAVQTILANTQSKGTTITDVNSALDELNTYADKTIYNFTEMTRNIGTFTAAGVDLDKSVTSIKGIANLAAVSGSTSTQASTAMYQLSQALAAGKVSLMDWNSVVNAGMGGEVFQNALKRTAEHMGTDVDAIIKKYGSFRESLTQGEWLTADVLTETLTQLSGAYTEADLISQGYTKKQAQEIVQLAKTAESAATDVKTFTQLWDTLKESAQSGWTQTWEIIVGDFEEAKTLLSNVSKVIGDMIGKSAEARNNLLQGWKDEGGRTMLIEALSNAFEGLMSVITPIKEAFREIFPPLTVDQLVKFTEGLKNFTENLILSDEASNNLKRTFKGIFAVVDIVRQAFVAVFEAISPLFGGVTDLGGGILEITANIGDWLVNLNNTIKTTDIFGKTVDKVRGFIEGAIEAVKNFIRTIKEKFDIPGFDLMDTLLENGATRVTSLKDAFVTAFEAIHSAISNSSIVDILFSVWDAMKTIGSGIGEAFGILGGGLVDAFGDADFSGFFDIINKIIAGGVGVGIISFLHSVTDTFSSFGDIVDGVVDVFDGVRGCFEAYQTQLKAGTLLKIAAAIAILAASIVVISLIDSKKLAESLGAITVLFADLMGSMAIFSRISGDLTGVFKTSTAMIAMSVAVLILASALKKISGLDPGEMATGLVGIVGLTGTLVGAMKILGSGDKTVLKGATQMVIFSAAISILANVCIKMAQLSWNEIAKGLVGVGVLMAGASLFVNHTKMSGKAITTATGIVILSSAMLILASACEDFAQMEWSEIGKGLVAIGALLAEIAIFTNVTGNARHIISSGIALIAIGASIHIFASAIQELSSLSWKQLGKGLSGMAGALISVAIATRIMPKNMISVGIGLTAVSGAMLILSDALSKMGGMSWTSIAKGMVAIGGSMLILAVGLNAMTGTTFGSIAMLVAAASLNALVPVLTTLGGMSWSEIGKGLLTLAGAFAVIGVAGYLLQPVVPAILALSGALALIGVGVAAVGAGLLLTGLGLSAIATAFSMMGPAMALGATSMVAALSIVILGIAELIPAVCVKIGEGLIEIAAVIAEGAPVIGEAFKAVALTCIEALVECVPQIVDGALVLLDSVLSSLVEYTPTIVDALFQFIIGILDGVAENLPDLIQSVVDVFMSFFSGVVDALQSIDTTTLIEGIAGVGLMAGMMLALSAVAGLTPGAMVGVLGMGAVIAELALVLAAIGALAQIPGLDWLINEGGALLGSIGTAIGQFVGGIVGGIAEGITSSLPQIGTDLSTFMTNVQPFIDGVKGIDSTVVEGVGTLVGAVLALTAADLLESLTSWLTGGSSLADFGAELAAFGPYMKTFSDSVAGIDSEAVSASATAAKNLAEMANNLPNEGGFLAKITGDNTMDTFGSQLVTFGTSLKAYSDAIIGIDAEAIAASATAAASLSDLANNLPNEGGFLADLIGDNTMDAFGSQLVTFGTSLKAYSESVIGLDIESISASATAAGALSDLANNLPNEGGFLADLIGDNTMEGFATQLVTFGRCLKRYSDAVVGINNEAITSSATAASSLSDLANNLPNDGGFLADLVGDNTIDSFGSDLITFGKGLKSYSESVAGIDVDAIASSATAAASLSDLANNLPNEGGFVSLFAGDNGIDSFGESLVSFGSAMKDYSDEVSGISASSLASSTAQFEKLADLAQDMSGIDFGGMESFGESLGSIGSDGVNEFIEAFSDASTKASNAAKTLVTSILKTMKSTYPQFAAEGTNVIKRFLEGVSKSKNTVMSAFKSTMLSATTAISSLYSSFYSAGSYLVSGFSNGISDNAYKAAAKASAMATAAKNAAEEALGIASPSRVFYQIGAFTGQGFINALSDYGNNSYKAGAAMADSARNGLNDAIARTIDVFNGDVELQPTIRPVLDLSNVRSGTNALGSILNSASTVRLFGDVTEISSMMNQRIQNGGSEDVVSAINKLRKDIGNVGGNTYNVNGVTYDDGSNVSEAVKSLVRAARIERRV